MRLARSLPLTDSACVCAHCTALHCTSSISADSVFARLWLPGARSRIRSFFPHNSACRRRRGSSRARFAAAAAAAISRRQVAGRVRSRAASAGSEFSALSFGAQLALAAAAAAAPAIARSRNSRATQTASGERASEQKQARALTQFKFLRNCGSRGPSGEKYCLACRRRGRRCAQNCFNCRLASAAFAFGHGATDSPRVYYCCYCRCGTSRSGSSSTSGNS